jgi:hypothetical protein
MALAKVTVTCNISMGRLIARLNNAPGGIKGIDLIVNTTIFMAGFILIIQETSKLFKVPF